MKRFFYTLIALFLFTSTALAVETAETIYAKAYSNLYRNNTRAAISILQRGINSFPDIAFLYAGLGDAYLKEGNYSKAMDLYTTAQKKKYAIDNYKIDFYNASLKKDYSNVAASLKSLMEATKSFDSELLFKNINYIMNENYEKTDIITEIYINQNDTELSNANSLKSSKQLENALKAYLTILNKNPKNFQAANNAGVALIELRDYNLAEKYLKLALDINPDSAIILNNLAVAESHLNKTQEAENHFEQALKIKSDYMAAMNNIATGKIHDALSHYQTQNVESILDTVKKDNENQYAMRVLAQIYFFKGDYKNSNVLLSSQNSSYNFKLYTQKAYTALKSGDKKNALTYINQAIALYSDNSIDYEIRGRINDALGLYPEAIADYQKAITKDKNNTNVYYYYARTLYRSGSTQEAINTMKTFVSLKKGNPQASQLRILFE